MSDQISEWTAEMSTEQTVEMTTEQTVTQELNGPAAPEQAGKKKNRAAVLSIAAGAVCLSFQVILFIAYALGVLNAYERSLNPISAIEFMLDLFFFQWSRAVKCLVGVVAGVAYIVIFVLLIIKIVKACRLCFGLLREPEQNSKKLTTGMLRYSMESFRMVMVYAVVVNSFTGAAVSGWIIAIMALMVVSYAFARVTIQTDTEFTTNQVLGIVGDVITATVVCLMYWLCKEPAGENVLTGLSMLFGGFIGFGFGFKAFMYSFFCNLVEPIMNIALIIRVLRLAGKVHQNPYDTTAQSQCMKTMIYSATILGLQFLLRIFFSFQSRYLSMDMLNEWFFAVRAFNLPIFLLLLAAWLILKFALPHGKKYKTYSPEI